MSLTASTTDIVTRLWSLCHKLRSAGLGYMEYATELSYLIFLKMMLETDRDGELPEGYRWRDLTVRDGVEQLHFYQELLLHLGRDAKSQIVKSIFAGARTALNEPVDLKVLTDAIDGLDWYDAKTEGLGNLYEGLMERTASEKKTKAGQYFTPRPLIDCMVNLTKPQPGEIIQDPAAGTGGFLVAAHRYIKEQTDDLFSLTEAGQQFQKKEAFEGVELAIAVYRLLLMNLLLHDIEGRMERGSTLTTLGSSLRKADLILTNPPFGTQTGGQKPARDDFTFPTSNWQLAFLQHIYRGLKPGGRAAVVLPDNVLFEGKTGASIRADLMDKCNLRTILRLPTGIFYAQGVKTNVLFFTRGQTDHGNTRETWIYDMRTNMPNFGKRTPFTREYFREFEACYGDDPAGSSERVDGGEESRFRRFTRDEIRGRGENLDITWLRDESAESGDDLPPPEEIAAEIMMNLQTAVYEMEALMGLLEAES